MTAEDIIMLLVVFPAILIPGWIVVLRIWRQGRDIYDQAGAVKWVTPESARHGYHAFLLPTLMSMTLSGPATGVYVVWESGGSRPLWVGDVILWVYGLCFGLLVLAFWLWAFMWPRVLVPPHLRGERGWVVAALRGRTENEAAESSSAESHRSP